jgi:hypothetical protein
MPRHAPMPLPVQPPTGLTGPWERWWPVIGALLYAGVLASLPSESLKDRNNYAAHLEYAALALLAWLDRDLLSVLTNEPLFLLLNLALGAMLPVEQSLELLVFVPAAIVAHAVLRTDPRHGVYLLVVLLLPQVLQKHVIHLRQGVAIVMFVVAWFATSPRLRWPLIAMTPFVHASFFFVLMLMGAAWAVRRLRLSPRLVRTGAADRKRRLHGLACRHPAQTRCRPDDSRHRN